MKRLRVLMIWKAFALYESPFSNFTFENLTCCVSSPRVEPPIPASFPYASIGCTDQPVKRDRVRRGWSQRRLGAHSVRGSDNGPPPHPRPIRDGRPWRAVGRDPDLGPFNIASPAHVDFSLLRHFPSNSRWDEETNPRPTQTAASLV